MTSCKGTDEVTAGPHHSTLKKTETHTHTHKNNRPCNNVRVEKESAVEWRWRTNYRFF